MEERFKQQGEFGWCELITTDVNSAKEFYTKIFGWDTEDMSMGDMKYTVLKIDEKPVGGMMHPPPEAQGMPPAWGIYVTVDDVDATAQMVKEMGGAVVVEPRDIPEVGRFCVIQDPQGAFISAITYQAD